MGALEAWNDPSSDTTWTRDDKARSTSTGIFAGGFSLPVPITELYVLQPDASAWIRRATTEVDSHRRRRGSLDVAIGHLTNLHPRILRNTVPEKEID